VTKDDGAGRMQVKVALRNVGDALTQGRVQASVAIDAVPRPLGSSVPESLDFAPSQGHVIRFNFSPGEDTYRRIWTGASAFEVTVIVDYERASKPTRYVFRGKLDAGGTVINTLENVTRDAP
jgi:hypothetical protein